MNKLSYKEKVDQYLNAVIRLNRNINARDTEFFTDYTPMYDWFRNQMTAIRKFLKNPDKVSSSSKENYKMFQEILKKIDEFENDKKTEMDNRADYYLEVVRKMKKRIGQKNNLKFKNPDNGNMHSWFLIELRKIELNRKNNVIPTEEEMKKIETIAYILNEYYNFDIENYQRKVDQYIEVIDRIGGLPGGNCYYKFDDNIDMYSWFSNQNRQFIKERKEEITPNHKRMSEAKAFAKIFNHLYDMNHIRR